MNTRRAETWPSEDVADLTVARCDREIEILVQAIVACHCECPTLLLEINRWKQRRLHLQTPHPRQGT